MKSFLWIIAGFIILISIGGFFLYNNFNRLLSEALIKSFETTIASDVYELKFKDLNVNLFLGDIKVFDVELHPREKPLKDYTYINSSFRLSTKKLLLSNVEILTLLKQNILKLEQIEITEPEILFDISDAIPVFIPFNDSPVASDTTKHKNKRPIEAFFLKKFELRNASFKVLNSAKQRDLSVKQVNIYLSDLSMNQKPGMDILSYSKINVSIGEINGILQKERIKHISLKDYNLIIDSLNIQKTIDTVIYNFDDFNLSLKDLDVQTADSIFHLTLQSFDLSYQDKSLLLKKLAFMPNITEQALQDRHQFQNAQFSGIVGTLKMTGINFDSLFFKNKLFIDEINLDSVSASIFKDKTKAMDFNRFPKYLGQSIKEISVPINITKLNATNVNILNRERNVDSTYAAANINRATVFAGNITNFPTDNPLLIKADAYLENIAHFYVSLGFDYVKPQFSVDASFEKFNLADLNQLIGSYTPANVKTGIVDELSFSGNVYHTNASGTMKFLYHDLNINLELKEKAKWKSSVLAFAANTIVATANPASANVPPRIVKYHVERDMNKAFINITIKSALAGLKETAIMSKENRKAYKEDKKVAKEEGKN